MAKDESSFSWAIWTPNTTFRLCNVTWDMSYRDIVKFDNPTEQYNWFQRQPATEFKGGSMSRFGLPVRLPIPFNEASKYNYLVVYNDYPTIEEPRVWYYFVQSLTYVNANVTQANIMLDVWQSFQFDIELGMCYVERGHAGVANTNQWKDHGKTYLSLSEGLDTGSETAITHQQWKSLMGVDSEGGVDLPNYGVIVVSNTDLTADAGDERNPHLKTASGSFFESLPNGCQFVYFDKWLEFTQFMLGVSDTPWVSQGITSIYLCPRIDPSYLGDIQDIHGGKGYIPHGGWKNRVYEFLKIGNFRQYFNIPQRYRYLRKFLTFPYASIELTSLNGQSLILKPELIDSDDLTIDEMHGMAQPNARLKFYPKGYNSNGGNVIDKPTQGTEAYGNGAAIDSGEYLSAACGIDNLPQFTIVNNNALAVIASQAHSLNWQYSNASWAQAKTQMGANNAYAQAQLSTQYATQGNKLAIGNRNAMNSITANSLTNSTDIAQQQAQNAAAINMIGTAANGVVGVAGNIASGNGAGAIGAIVGTGINVAQQGATYANDTAARQANLQNTLGTNAAQTSQANSYGTQTTNLSNSQTMEFADMNRNLANAVASGDYANTIAGINAKIQDMALIQPSNSGAMGGDAFNVSNGNFGLLVRFRQLQPYAMQMIGEYWLRYGYYVQRFMTPPQGLMCMTKFTFWKMHELYIKSSTCPEEYRLTIKGIFEKGVTVWAKPEYIGQTDYGDNEPMDNISF